MLFRKVIAFTVAALAALSSFADEAPAKGNAVPASRFLVAYYSWSESGNTKYVAEQIQKATKGVLLEIKPKNAYPKDYNACLAQAQKEIRDGIHPELANEPVDFKKYDVIFIGSPNWFGTIAPPAASFLVSADLDGKTVIPFFTYGSGGMQNCERDAKKLMEKAGKVLPAKAFRGASVREADKEIIDWIEKDPGIAAALKTPGSTTSAAGFYGFELTSWDGIAVKTAGFKDKVVLVVNTATRCGFTPQYERIEKIYKECHDKGLEILDIPCNQFGSQAPGSDEEIHTFCTSRYNTTFPQMSKCDVNGDKQIPLYKFLKEETKKEGGAPADIRWNFTKFVIGRDGKVVKRFEPGDSMDELEKLIKSLL